MRRTPCLAFRLPFRKFFPNFRPHHPSDEGRRGDFDPAAGEGGNDAQISPARSSIGRVPVVNLPSEPTFGPAFEAYRGNTADFLSTPLPYSSPSSKSGIGGGFGVRGDKNLSFLRPRKHNLAPSSEEDDPDTAISLAQRRMAFMKRFRGSTMSLNQHFLLADLDFDRDRLILGPTREDFEHNLGLLQNAILSYAKWERTDNIYYYCSLFLKILTAWTVMECFQQYYELHQLSHHLDDFIAVSQTEMEELAEGRRRDFAVAVRELRQNKIDFRPLLDAILTEKRRILPPNARIQAGNAEMGGNSSDLNLFEEKDGNFASHKVQNRSEETCRGREFLWIGAIWRLLRRGENGESAPVSREDFARFSYAANLGTLETLRAIRRILLPKSEDYTQIVREEMMEYKRDKEKLIALRT
ncbi:unnamed protein product [Phytomonas sp. Hart1]|nr:unnamed protein product [Phytomonas sp. Hart1]|eukprot:CCW69361.1 unnamed protein product [Phytomonas sp. isolate Hart1]